MPKKVWVNIVNVETGDEARVIDSTVPAWERNGWTLADNESSETVSEEPVAGDKPVAKKAAAVPVAATDDKKE
jgi:hypothetical protein